MSLCHEFDWVGIFEYSFLNNSYFLINNKYSISKSITSVIILMSFRIVLNRLNANGVPRHVLHLKINDICIVTRALKTGDLATNARVKILSISTRIIKARTLDDSPRNVIISRIHFKFKLDYGESYPMMRWPTTSHKARRFNKSFWMLQESLLVTGIYMSLFHEFGWVGIFEYSFLNNSYFLILMIN